MIVGVGIKTEQNNPLNRKWVKKMDDKSQGFKEFVIRCERAIKKYKRAVLFKRQQIKYKRWCK